MFHGFTFASHFKLLRELFEKLKLVIKINENLKFHVLIFFIKKIQIKEFLNLLKSLY